MPQIVVRNLYKTYTNGKVKTPVLRGLDIDVHKGEFISIVGPSGSGKTTLLYTLGGLEPYDEGSVRLFDQELSTFTDAQKSDLRSQKLGFVFQFYHLIPNLTAFENVMLSSIIGKQKSKEEILDILRHVGMDQYASYYPSQLSGGMQQRISIARALINDPEIIFADEPTGNLDVENGTKIMELLRHLNQTIHKTIVMVTHNEDATLYGTRTLHMLDGKVIKDEIIPKND